jgi:hypothetical protein
MLPFLLLACAFPEIVPEAGVYLFSDLTGSSTCEGETFGTESLRVGVIEDPPTVEILDAEIPLVGLTFAARLWSETTDYNETISKDAVIVDTGGIEGVWVSSTVIEGRYVAEEACMGNYCEMLKPCATAYSFTLETPTE